MRPPAVAGTFYPDDPAELRALVQRCLAEGRLRAGQVAPPKALIVPHAGLIYSGPVAGSAYATLEPVRLDLRRVLLLGPSHRVPLRGLALPASEAFRTPLGDIALDRAAAESLVGLPQVSVLEAAHAEEHSLEVQLPFLQELLPAFELVPLVVGSAPPEAIAEVIETLWGGAETLVLVSSDLSHFYDYETARRLDVATSRAIEALQPGGLDEESACGRVPVRGLLLAARRHELGVQTLDLRSSGDTAGDRDRVVGYGAYAFA